MSTTNETTLEIITKAVYRHFDGHLVQVVKVVEHSETTEKLILVSVINTPGIWRVVPVEEFTGYVDADDLMKPRYSMTDIKISTLGGMLIAHSG